MMETVIEIVSAQKRLFTGLAVLVLLNAGMLVFDVAYLSPEVSVAMSKWGELRRLSILAGKTDINAVYRQGAQDLEAVKARLTTTRQFPKVIGGILQQAALSKVTLGKMSYKPVTGKDQKLPAYAISMSASGGYLELKCFLSDLLQSDAILIVDTIKLSSGSQPEDTVTMDLSLTVYFRGEA